MTMIRQVMPLEATDLGPGRVRVIAATDNVARDGNVIEMSGVDVRSFSKIGVILWNHDAAIPVGNPSEIEIGENTIAMTIDFAPEGVSEKADEIRKLVKAGVVRAVSVGFVPLESEPLDPKKPRGGQRFTRVEILEVSFCSVPADPGAIVTARANETKDTLMPTDRSEARTRMLVTDHKPRLRGLYDCAILASALSQLGYLHNDAVWEAEVEGDDSPVPAMLGEVLKQLGDTLIAMTAEEVNELLAGHGVIDEDDVLPAAERTFIAGASTDRARAWRRGIAAMRTRAGRVLSQGNAKKLTDAAGHITDGSTRADDAEAHQTNAGEHGEALADLHSRAVSAHDKMGDEFAGMDGVPAEATEHLAKVKRHHKALGKHLDAMGERCAAIGDAQADAMASIAGTQRSLRSALRCVHAVTDGSSDTDSEDAETSEDDEAANDRAFAHEFRTRQAVLMELSAA